MIRSGEKFARLKMKPEKILIVKLSAIGDVIHALPVAGVLRDAYPGAEISWIVEDKAEDIVRGNPNLDRVIVLPRQTWKKEFKIDKWGTFRAVIRFFWELRKTQFDLALDLQGLFKSGLVTWLSGAKTRLGYNDGREGSTIFYNQQVKPPVTGTPVVERYLNLAGALGINWESVNFEIAVGEDEKRKITGLLSLFADDNKAKLAAINPFTSWTSKDWLIENYAELADRLISELSCRVIFTGSNKDRGKIKTIMNRMDNNQVGPESGYRTQVINLAGKTNLKELAELYRYSDIFIGGDTGPMHLAAAVRTPVVALMGPTNPARNGPYGQGHLVIQSELDCINCWQRVCPRSAHDCMEAIKVDDVFAAVKKILRDEFKDE